MTAENVNQEHKSMQAIIRCPECKQTVELPHKCTRDGEEGVYKLTFWVVRERPPFYFDAEG